MAPLDSESDSDYELSPMDKNLPPERSLTPMDLESQSEGELFSSRSSSKEIPELANSSSSRQRQVQKGKKKTRKTNCVNRSPFRHSRDKPPSGPYSKPKDEPLATTRVPRSSYGRARNRISKYSLPSGNLDTTRHVEDACAVGNTIVLAYTHAPVQLSYIPISHNKRPNLVDLEHTPHQTVESQTNVKHRPPKLSRCLAPGPDPLKDVLTAGYDRSLRKWALKWF
ncbi:hypothetical protein VKT23_009808 [Stygiomarasmius scandens]|uniref:Uncharacterized protein n=1 Tax=Marasmiellus scandens TaxID=2682957 RepID=A0ABR1JDF3_9AGAR